MFKVSILVVLLEGLISFFSPCVLPIIPLYMGVLSNSSITKLNSGKYDNKSLLFNTISFTLGISTTFFILGTSITLLSSLLSSYSNYISLIGGILVVIMGLFYLGVLKLKLLNKDSRKIIKVDNATILNSYILGFTFSFGWTPCIGTVLTSVLLMSSASESAFMSYILIGVYTLGFTLPFLVIALFYSKLSKHLKWFKNRLSIIKKIGGVIILITGIVMSYNGYTAISNANNLTSNVEDISNVSAYDMVLKDQYGKEHKLSDYKGKKVFLNFWATWCPSCLSEMGDIEALYKEREDIVVLGVSLTDGSYDTEDSIIEFLTSNNYTFPTLMDSVGFMNNYFGIRAYPTTIILDEEGNITNKVEGALTKENMEFLVDNEN